MSRWWWFVTVTFKFVDKVLGSVIMQIKPSWQDVRSMLFIFLWFNWNKFYIGRTKSERLNWSLFEKRAPVQTTKRLLVIYANVERYLRWTIAMPIGTNKPLRPIFAFARRWGGRRRSFLLERSCGVRGSTFGVRSSTSGVRSNTSGVRSSISGVRGSFPGIRCDTVGVWCCHLCFCCLLSGESSCRLRCRWWWRSGTSTDTQLKQRIH